MVARRIETASSSRFVPPIATHVPVTQTSIPEPASSTHLTPPSTRATVALQDSLHYLYFMARHHLCHLLNIPPLAWYDTVPPPVVEQAIARQAVMSVIKGVAQTRMTREEGWEDWEGAFAETSAVEGSDRTSSETEVRALWSSLVGRSWNDGQEGEQVSVELE